ncbi:MAG: orotidine-5'-phosphate decarboxylase [Flavobacteriales bacterium]|nr:orotidine-5'-phosphate decarboxylase [Flavobacteriales bacterium]
MTRKELVKQIRSKRSFLCVGLDPDLEKMPRHLLIEPDPLFAFNKAVIDATLPYAVAYKPNLAFYEAHGKKGWESLRKTVEYLPKDVMTIADAKRGDIGNTSGLYARAFFEEMPFHAITVAPYMGEDSVRPFLEYDNKWVILLALTSNKGADDFQHLKVDGIPLYKKVLKASSAWGTADNMMYVVGATQAAYLEEIRREIPDHFLLVPGVGAQGGSLDEVARYGMNKDVGLLVNSSRSILYAGKGEDFAEKSAEEARRMQTEMAALMDTFTPVG